MKKELLIQKLIRTNGLQKTVDDLNLTTNIIDNLILLKYKQINVDWNKPAVHDCRGLILDMSNNYEVVSYPYKKFFNYGEKWADKINWNDITVFEKSDGSLITLYWYNNKWNVSTNGTVNGYSNPNLSVEYTFEKLFWKTVKDNYDINEFKNNLNTNYNYMFELCTPLNIVVTLHKMYNVFLHGVRDLNTFKLLNILDNEFVYFERVKTYNYNSYDEIVKQFDYMSWQEEGFVVVDDKFNMVKIKNPKYVDVHYTATGTSPYAIMGVVKENEIDEFLSYFDYMSDDIYKLKNKYDNFIDKLNNVYEKYRHIETDKEFALRIKNEVDKKLIGFLFSKRNGSINTFAEGLNKLHNKKLYKLIQ